MNMEKYTAIADKFNIIDFVLISPEQIVFDIRAFLKCRWGCSFSKNRSIRCETYGIPIEERRQMVNAYHTLFLLHNNNAKEMTHACLELEKELFMDGYYFAFALRTCNYCENCGVKSGKECTNPEKVRPCEEMFGIDVYQTARNLGLPIDVLQSREEKENRYGFVLIE
jgi:predicted metal-binding protein